MISELSGRKQFAGQFKIILPTTQRYASTEMSDSSKQLNSKMFC